MSLVIGTIAGILSAILISLAVALWQTGRRGPGVRRALAVLAEFVFRGRGAIFYLDRSSLVRQLGSVDSYVLAADQSVTYVGFWLSASLEQANLGQALQQLARSGRRFTACVIDPSDAELCAQYARYFGIPPQELTDRISASIRKIRDLALDLSPTDRGNIEILVHRETLTASVFLVDAGLPQSKVLVDHKLFGTARVSSYGMELNSERSDLARRFEESYRRILAGATSVTDQGAA